MKMNHVLTVNDLVTVTSGKNRSLNDEVEHADRPLH